MCADSKGRGWVQRPRLPRPRRCLAALAARPGLLGSYRVVMSRLGCDARRGDVGNHKPTCRPPAAWYPLDVAAWTTGHRTVEVASCSLVARTGRDVSLARGSSPLRVLRALIREDRGYQPEQTNNVKERHILWLRQLLH